MNKRKFVVLLLLVIFSSNTFALFGGGKDKLSRAEKKYLKKNNVSYQISSLQLTSSNEKDSLKGGYMSQDEVNTYITELVAKNLLDTNSKADQNKVVSVDAKLTYTRVFSWGRVSSLASLNYKGVILLSENGESRGAISVRGQIADRSILGDFKTTFAAKNSSKEKKYLNGLANSIVESLPK